MAGLITVLIVIILLTAVLLAGFLFVRNKIRHFSRAVYGTDDLIAGIKKTEEESASRPKSVAAMTRLILPRLTADFPDLTFPEIKSRSENLLTSYLRAINDGGSTSLPEDGKTLSDSLSHHLAANLSHGETEHIEKIHIHQTELAEYRKEKGRCVLVIQSSLESYHYFTGESKEVIRGSKERKEQTRYAMNMVYIQDASLAENDEERALAMTCPNCGAPLTSLGSKKCEYCGSPVLEWNVHAWAFSAIRQI